MAYVRKVRTASGAVAVQVVRKCQGRREIVAHVGSVHTDAELGILLEKARGIAEGAQQSLELEVPRAVAHLDEVADWRPADDAAAAPRVAGPGQTIATGSRLPYGVLGAVYDWLGFDEVVDDAVFRDLVIARIVEPTSKLDSGWVLTDLGVAPVSYRSIQRHLVTTVEKRYREMIAAKCFAYSRDCGGLRLILYDATTLYFDLS